MAGRGSRFSTEGYDVPKPFIEVNGKPMVERVVQNINLKHCKFIFICQKSHLTESRKKVLENLSNDVEIVAIDGYTRGTAETVLIGTEDFDLSGPIYIVNSDQLVTWDHDSLVSKNPDGAVVCFNGSGENWSYVKLGNNDEVIEVAEKKKISDIATAGVYYWRSGDSFRKYAKAMIDKDLRVNGEFYVAPVYQEAINDKKLITIDFCHTLEQLGTPEELVKYLENNVFINT